MVTADQTKALIEQGVQIPYNSASSTGGAALGAVSFQDAKLTMVVTPRPPDGNVILDVNVKNDSLGQSTSAGFAINRQHVQTQVLVENGGTSC